MREGFFSNTLAVFSKKDPSSVHGATRDFEIIRSPEELRAIAHQGWLDIMRCLMGKSMTGTQVAERLGLPATRVHYHLNELRRAGLLEESFRRRRLRPRTLLHRQRSPLSDRPGPGQHL